MAPGACCDRCDRVRPPTEAELERAERARLEALAAAGAPPTRPAPPARARGERGKGVFRHHRRWRTRVSCRGQLLHLGCFATEQEAERAVARWRKAQERARAKQSAAAGEEE